MQTATSTVSVPVSTRSFLELVDFLRRKGSDRDPVDVVETAIEYWIMNADWKEADLMPELFEKPQHIGYLWKNVLMPPGTRLRMTYKGQTEHATIEGDDLIHNGVSRTPSEFASLVAGGTARNAWRDIWIKRPQDQSFRLADELRSERRQARGE